MRERVIEFIDKQVFPFVISLVTSRAHIIFIFFLLVFLLNPTTVTVVMLILGNYTNVLSAGSSSIVLRQQSDNHEEIMEKHGTLTDYHEAHQDAFDHILEELDSIKNKLGMKEKEEKPLSAIFPSPLIKERRTLETTASQFSRRKDDIKNAHS